MSNAQNLAYSVVQVLHNFGAVATVGSAFAATQIRAVEARKKLAWLALAGWGTQAASGATFGMVSYYYYHHFPDISGIAMAALAIKISCAAAGFLLLTAYLFPGANWPEVKRDKTWLASLMLAATALTSAAFLRWFS